MKVLHFISSLGSGGAERQLSLIAPALQARGIDVHIAHCTGGPNLERLRDSPVTLHRLSASGNHDPRLLWQALQRVRRLGPDIVHTWLLQMDLFGGTAAKLAGTPWILSERSSAKAYPSTWKNRARLAMGRRADMVVANSNAGLEYWRERGTQGSLRLIRNCIAPARESTTDVPKHHGKLVIFVGRLSHDKNIQALLEAFIGVVSSQPDVSVKLIGEGPLHDTLAARIAASGHTARIQMLGFSDAVSSWMKEAALCVSVSGFEGHPNVVLEAASLGCPLVLSDIPAHREVLADDEALYVRPDSVEDIQQGILRVLAEPELASRRARAALQATQALTLDRAAEQYISVYADLLRSTRRAGLSS